MRKDVRNITENEKTGRANVSFLHKKDMEPHKMDFFELTNRIAGGNM